MPSTAESWQAELQALIAEAQAFEAYARPILARVPDCTGDMPDGAFDGAREWLCELYDQVYTERLQREAGTRSPGTAPILSGGVTIPVIPRDNTAMEGLFCYPSAVARPIIRRLAGRKCMRTMGCYQWPGNDPIRPYYAPMMSDRICMNRNPQRKRWFRRRRWQVCIGVTLLELIVWGLMVRATGCVYSHNLSTLSSVQACADLEFLAQQIRAIHPNPFRRQEPQAFEDKLQETQASDTEQDFAQSILPPCC